MPKSDFVSDSFSVLTYGYMKRAGLNNKELIRRMGVTDSTWARYKKKPWTIPQGVLRSYKHVLQLSAEETAKVVEAWR